MVRRKTEKKKNAPSSKAVELNSGKIDFKIDPIPQETIKNTEIIRENLKQKIIPIFTHCITIPNNLQIFLKNVFIFILYIRFLNC